MGSQAHLARRERREPTPAAALKRARSRANHRIAFMGHFVVFAGVVALILFTAGFTASFIVALSWGILLAAHGFFAVLAPVMKDQMVAAEVDRQLVATVVQERRTLGEEHARNMHRLSASVAHEIRNPVTAAKSLVQQMGEDPHSDQNAEYARVALDELDRVERSIAHLLRYAREEELQLSEVRFNELVQSTLDSFRGRLDGVKVSLLLDDDDQLTGDADKLRRILVNLIDNALDAMAEGAPDQPRLEIATGHNLAGDELWLKVCDNGCGIDPTEAGCIFDPFHTSKQRGTGLGLAITKKLVEAHRGTIDIDPTATEGTTMTVVFPLEEQSS